MNTSIIASSFVLVIGTTAELSRANVVSEHVQLVILGVTLLAFSSILRLARSETT
jgi:hypothetical protein